MGPDFSGSNIAKYTISDVFSVPRNNLKAPWLQDKNGFFSPTKIQLKSSSDICHFHSWPRSAAMGPWSHSFVEFIFYYASSYNVLTMSDYIAQLEWRKLPSNLEKKFPFEACRNLFFNLERNLQNQVVCMSYKYFLVFWPRAARYIIQPNMILQLSLFPSLCDRNSDKLRISSLLLGLTYPSLVLLLIFPHMYSSHN